MIDLSSWSAALGTLLSLLLITLMMVGIRLIFMQTLQKRRERENRQINERLRTLIAAYKTLGGSFTGSLQVHPTHLRDLRPTVAPTLGEEQDASPARGDDDDDEEDGADSPRGSTERQRRMRDAVEAALSDVILLGTPDQVALAAAAARDMVAGRSIHTAQLVVSLRQFIRSALDLEPIAQDVAIPHQGPVRPGSSAGGSRRAGAAAEGGGAGARRAGGAAGAATGGGMGGLMVGSGLHKAPDDAP